MRIEILALADCPNLEPARQIVQRALLAEGARAQVSVRVLEADAASAEGNFAGSPTILVNGRDIEPAPAAGCCCRLYSGGRGVPDFQSVMEAVRHAGTQGGR